MTSIFNQYTPEALRAYLASASAYKRFDEQHAYGLALAAIHYYKGTADVRDILVAGQALENKWYESLRRGKPDYAVYDDEFFVSDIWACWVVYSRRYLRMLQKIVTTFEDIKTVADLGCGIGYTTAGLAELFPDARVYGTQLESSFQFRVAAELGAQRNFTVHSAIQSNTDLVFASEYFEHFQRPIEHLLDVVRIGQPQYFILANSFGARSIGHFDEYLNADKKIANSSVGRSFNAVLRNCGYKRVETGFWNNRPAVWTRES